MMKANKQIGFININEESIDKILKDGEVVFERGFLREKTSTTLPITFGGVGKNLKDYKVYGNTAQSKLPNGYTQVDFIESDANSYIDMGLKGNQNTKIATSVLFKNAGTFVGDITDSSQAISLRFSPNNSGAISRFGDKSVTGIFATYSLNARYLIETSSSGVKVDNNVIHQWQNITPFETALNLYLFKNTTASESMLMCLYNCKVYDNDVLVRNFIPCYRNLDNEIGLYDLVNDVFYTNQGTGVFTYGSIAPTPDAPIEIVSCGDRTKNLFDLSKVSEYTAASGIQISVVQENVKVKGTNSSSSAVGVYLNSADNYYSLKAGKTYVAKYITGQSASASTYRLDIRPTSSTGTILAYETGENGLLYTPTEDINIRFYVRIPANGTVDLSGKIIFEESDTLHDYEPYGYKIPVNVRSENVFTNNIFLSGYNLTDNGGTSANVNYYVVKQTNIKPLSKYILSENQNYALSSGGDSPVRVCAYDVNDSFISLILKDVRTEIKRYNDEFVIPANTDYILIGFRNTDTNIELIESIDTNIYIDEPLRKIDGYSDYIDFINGKVVRQLGEVILDGSETWVRLSTSTQDYYRFAVDLGEKIAIKSNANDVADIFSDKFIGISRDNTNRRIDGIAQSSANRYYKDMVLYSDVVSQYTVEQFKTWLSTHNTIVDYVLATPTEEDIELPNIPTIDGNNTLNIETEITPSQVYIKYKSNT